MPVSRSRNRGPKTAAPPERARAFWPFVLIGVIAIAAVVVATLPASLLKRFLPASVSAQDFSGSLWHGSAGTITFNSRNAGALEWQLHPSALFKLAIEADVHWVKGGFALDALGRLDGHGFSAQNVRGGGPIEALGDLGMDAGWRGTAAVKLDEIKGDFSGVSAATGDIQVTNLASNRVAGGSDLGDYDLNIPPGAVAADGSTTAKLSDRGGPVQLQADIRLSPKERSGLLSGTMMARAEAAPALRSQIDNLAQLRVRDSQGRIPVEFEFTF
jgi:hypothetical protein